jgi:hypothetical protein
MKPYLSWEVKGRLPNVGTLEKGNLMVTFLQE